MSLNKLGEISSYPAEQVFISVKYFSVSAERIGGRYKEKWVRLDKYFLCEWAWAVLLVIELPNRRKCSLNLSAGLLHGG